MEELGVEGKLLFRSYYWFTLHTYLSVVREIKNSKISMYMFNPMMKQNGQQLKKLFMLLPLVPLLLLLLLTPLFSMEQGGIPRKYVA